MSESQVLQRDETFAVFDAAGNMSGGEFGEHGLFHQGTRYLRDWTLEIDGHALEHRRLVWDAATSGFECELETADGTLGVFRSRFLIPGALHERVRVENRSGDPVEVRLRMHWHADFADVFEIRGFQRERRGDHAPVSTGVGNVMFTYLGLDETLRVARIDLDLATEELTADYGLLLLRLETGASRDLDVAVSCAVERVDEPPRFETARARASTLVEERGAGWCQIETDNAEFNNWIRTSAADLQMLIAVQPPFGPYPYAGIPWYSTPFGRDGIITALELLWVEPGIARGVLGYLASRQATQDDPARDAQPGKIAHEIRRGEMAKLGEHPFGRYYGSSDSTPLFVMLAGEYWEATGDKQFLLSLRPQLEAALDWIERLGDVDEDGFLEYAPSGSGLIHQGWKDSGDPVFHQDGTPAELPIAMCEIQGYAYAGRRSAAELLGVLGDEGRAQALGEAAEKMRARFEEAFWCEDEQTYAMALDGRKVPCRVRSSNPGHVLFSGLASPERAARLAVTLLEPDLFSGWGVRTLGSNETRYDPGSYHNGSVWPHDNALIAAGLARYGHTEAALRIVEGLFAVSRHSLGGRIPELFCGDERRGEDPPVWWPGACAPQAWAAGAVFLLLQACLGLRVRGAERAVTLHHPVLPTGVSRISLAGMTVGDATVDLEVRRDGAGTKVVVGENPGGVSVESI